uniref:Microfibril associated protein 2 n=1 Tax=Accipiter nisus TaxID=211598 RepID=A0A8B9MPN9_9AVES
MRCFCSSPKFALPPLQLPSPGRQAFCHGFPRPPSETSCLFLLADCREEQYPCTRLYSVHKPCKQCLNEICFYSLRRVYVINKEICVRTVCAHEELLRGDPPSPAASRDPNPFPSSSPGYPSHSGSSPWC